MPRYQRGGDAAIAAPVPKTAGTGEPKANTEQLKPNAAVNSGGMKTGGLTAGPYANLGAQVTNINGYDILKFNMSPGASVITNQETMSYMDGGLSTNATLGSSGFFGALLRGLTGSSVLQNAVTNPTQNPLKMILSPLLQGSILQIDIKAGETWRFADKSFLACTPNLNVSGNVNIFSNFRLMFVGENLTYTTISATQGGGTVWISSFGAIEKHDVVMGTGSTVPLFINNGCFLGMLDNNGSVNFWNDYVTVGTANGLFSAMFTQLGWIMKIQDSTPPRRPGPITCTVFTQSLNPHNFEKYIAHIAQQVVNKSRNSSSHSFLTSGVGPGASSAALGTGAALGLGAAAVPAVAPAGPFPGFFPTAPAAAQQNYAAPAQQDYAAPAQQNYAPAQQNTAPAQQNAAPAQQNAVFGGTRNRRNRRTRRNRR